MTSHCTPWFIFPHKISCSLSKFFVSEVVKVLKNVSLFQARGEEEGRLLASRRRTRASAQGSSERWSPVCVNAAGKARQKWYARAGTKFSKPGDHLLAEPCRYQGPKSHLGILTAGVISDPHLDVEPHFKLLSNLSTWCFQAQSNSTPSAHVLILHKLWPPRRSLLSGATPCVCPAMSPILFIVDDCI